MPGTKITRYYLRRHLHRVIKRRHHLSPQLPTARRLKHLNASCVYFG